MRIAGVPQSRSAAIAVRTVKRFLVQRERESVTQNMFVFAVAPEELPEHERQMSRFFPLHVGCSRTATDRSVPTEPTAEVSEGSEASQDFEGSDL